ncbi:hypothetical protein [Mycobacteroides abscessus]|uniref:hypothetical protein n=1 Tax=Mycobacteroides abscessus TaxID=36809 RepID=UPI00092C72A6|nr:hypothetical protein [Mycobacteroides abscessus]SIG31200.1 Uncharacterised protein [Mycobacteroides abscessus subsp. abscessus]SIH57012.1 Uncharacterised protein [Mycobacteroides abscessus subsp. abscessus]SIM81351.1 Uncharacterised protein [Mycobacteroides abscessus subsp. abscessus]
MTTTYTVTREQLDAFQVTLDDLDEEVSAQVRDDYSGRGMYGNTCIGVVMGDLRFLPAITAELAYIVGELASSDDVIALTEFLWELPTETDSMGRSTIVYWPNVRLATDY